MRNNIHEKDLSAQQTSPQARTRLSQTHEYTPRSKNLESSSQSRSPSAYSCLKRGDFQAAGQGKNASFEHVVLTYSFTPSTLPQIGIVVSKRFGKAFERNRFKRLVREAVRQLNLPPSLCLLIKPRTAAKKANMQTIKKEIIHFLSHYPIELKS